LKRIKIKDYATWWHPNGESIFSVLLLDDIYDKKEKVICVYYRHRNGYQCPCIVDGKRFLKVHPLCSSKAGKMSHNMRKLLKDEDTNIVGVNDD